MGLDKGQLWNLGQGLVQRAASHVEKQVMSTRALPRSDLQENEQRETEVREPWVGGGCWGHKSVLHLWLAFLPLNALLLGVQWLLSLLRRLPFSCQHSRTRIMAREDRRWLITESGASPSEKICRAPFTWIFVEVRACHRNHPSGHKCPGSLKNK